MTEQQLQAACFIWHWNTYPEERGMLFHVDNNSANRITGNLKKSQGVVKGISDFILIGDGFITFIEMKTEIGKLTPIQIKFKETVTSRGHIHIVVRDLETFKSKIRNIYGR